MKEVRKLNSIANAVVIGVEDETQKDIWYYKNIPGARIPASNNRGSLNSIDFTCFPLFYRDFIKRYFRTIVTKKSVSHCQNIYKTLKVFFSEFYEMEYKDGFLKKLQREDIEKYLYRINTKYKTKNVTYVNKFMAYPRTFLEYIQMAKYEIAPEKEVAFLIYQDDIPARERDTDRLQRIKFIPEPILQQLDNNIMDLDNEAVIPIYILLRETGWRGTDILNLRYDNCLEKIWNNKECCYNHYLCGEITKTGIAVLKVPIRDTVSEMIEKCMTKAKELSNSQNNPDKYLFNTYEGVNKCYPITKDKILYSIKSLIYEKDIKDSDGNLFKFKMHSLRHTRAKEYVEQGMPINIVQQILGHRSLQMTIYYATVSENALYEKWKATEDLDLFKVNLEDTTLEKIDTKENENIIRYEYVRKNLDAVKVPFGVCFKSSKLACEQQINHCLICADFCTTLENLDEYNDEIIRVKDQIEISKKCGRKIWQEKNEKYLEVLNQMVIKIKEQKVVHKNAGSREEM
jgi:site-specific recombinase XerD